MNNTALDIKIYNNGTTEITTSSNGLKKSVFTQLQDVANLFSSYASSYTPLLPEGTIKFGNASGGRMKLLLSFDEHVYNQAYSVSGNRWTSDTNIEDMKDVALEYECEEYEDDDDEYNFKLKTYLPKTLFLVDLIQEGTQVYINTEGCRLFHYFDELLLDNTKLHPFPFGNVFSGYGLCFGGMAIQSARYPISDLRGLKSILFNWESSISNTDLDYMVENYRSVFDFINKYAGVLKDVEDLRALKADNDKYTEVRKMLEENMKDCGITFGSFMSDYMR